MPQEFLLLWPLTGDNATRGVLQRDVFHQLVTMLKSLLFTKLCFESSDNERYWYLSFY